MPLGGLIPSRGAGRAQTHRTTAQPTEAFGRDGIQKIPWNDGKPPTSMMENWIQRGEFDFPDQLSLNAVYKEHEKAGASEAMQFLTQKFAYAQQRKLQAGIASYQTMIDSGLQVVRHMQKLGVTEAKYAKEMLKATADRNMTNANLQQFRRTMQGDDARTHWRSLRGK